MVTGSRMAAVMSKYKTEAKKNDETAERANYKMEVVVSRLTGLAIDHYVSPAMVWGIEHEEEARAAYELNTGAMVEPAGFAIHPTIQYFGASPDGLLGSEGLLEIKCPESRTHLEYVTAGTVPSEYLWQMCAELACTERKWVDFVSFDPRMPKHLRLFVRRYNRDDAKIAQMEAEVVKFLGEVDAVIASLPKA